MYSVFSSWALRGQGRSATPPRDRPKKGDGGRKFSPERGEDLEDEMVYDEDTEKSNLIAEAVSYIVHVWWEG